MSLSAPSVASGKLRLAWTDGRGGGEGKEGVWGLEFLGEGCGEKGKGPRF